MEEIRLVCGNCGKETFRPAKEPPTNAREAKQTRFHCEHCGVVNLRDGTVRVKKTQEVQEITEQKNNDSSGDKGIFTIVMTTIVSVVAFIILKKSIKGPGGTGNNLGNSGQGTKYPWRPTS